MPQTAVLPFLLIAALMACLAWARGGEAGSDWVRVLQRRLPISGRVDVLVVGSNEGGLAAAWAARAAGSTVFVAGGHYFFSDEVAAKARYWLEADGEARSEFARALLADQDGLPHLSPARYKRRIEALLLEAGIGFHFNTHPAAVLVDGSGRVAGAVLANKAGVQAVVAKGVIDATSTAALARMAGAAFTPWDAKDVTVSRTVFGTRVPDSREIGKFHEYSLAAPMPTGSWPERCRANVLPLDHADVHSLTLHHVLARKAGKQDVWDFYPMMGIRETRLVRGDHVIDVADQILGRTYRDLISVSQSAYDPHGYHNSDLVYAGLMPPTKRETREGFLTYIPLRSLLPRGLDGILVVGRCHSVTHDVQASVRMNPDVINEGYAAGRVAAEAVKTGKPLREVDLAPVQDHLAEVGNISAEDRRTRCVDMPEPTAAQLAAAARHVADKVQLATLTEGGSRSIPHLRESFQKQPTLAKAKALCTLGDAAAVGYLVAWLGEHPLEGGRGYQWDAFLSVPEVDAAMWLLGAAGGPRAVPALAAKLGQCSTGGDSFSHVRAATTALGRIGSPEAAPALHRFLSRDGAMGHIDVEGRPASLKADAFAKAYVELHAAAALLRCGDHEGLGRRILTAYLDDWRGVLVRFAGHVLEHAPESSP